MVLASLFGGVGSVPIARLPSKAACYVDEILALGVRCLVPVVRRSAPTILVVNLGGAVIPLAASVLLLLKDSIR